MAVNDISQPSKVKGWFVFIYVLFVLACFYPYEFYTVYFPFLSDKDQSTALFFMATTIIIMLFSTKFLPIGTSSWISVFIMQMVGFFLVSMAHDETIKHVMVQAIPILLSLLLIVYIHSTVGLVDFYKKYNRWILIMAILGSVAFIGVFFFRI